MIQDFFAQSTFEKRLVNSLSVLKTLERAELITLHAQTGKKVSWYGQTTKAWYIDDCKNSSFEYRNRKFVVEYRSGSFFPYVYALYTPSEVRDMKFVNHTLPFTRR